MDMQQLNYITLNDLLEQICETQVDRDAVHEALCDSNISFGVEGQKTFVTPQITREIVSDAVAHYGASAEISEKFALSEVDSWIAIEL